MFDLKPPYFLRKDVKKNNKILIDLKPVEISKLGKQQTLFCFYCVDRFTQTDFPEWKTVSELVRIFPPCF
jgi:hypothetical protein